MGKRKIISIWTIILLMIVPASGCNVLSTSKQSFDYTELNVFSVKEAYVQIDETAKQWDKDAYLKEVLLFLYPKTDNAPFRATFMYLSYSSPHKAINISYIVQEVVEIETREFNLENSESSGSRLDPDILSLDSQDSLKIMYEQLGNEFFQGCRVVSWPLIMTLEYGFPNVSDEEVWSMSFACDKPEKGAAIIISAETGDVLEIRR